ncbi:MAG: PEP-CTERM sorting domain-containing protein [Phycisphaerae bacterium]
MAITSQAQAAATTTGGPYIDFKGYLGTDYANVNNGGTIATSSTVWKTTLLNPPGVVYTAGPYQGPYETVSSYQVTLTDSMSVLTSDNDPTGTWRSTVGVSYLTYDMSSTTADLLFTTIYGIDSNPTLADAVAMTGYSMSGPPLTMSGESVLGADGIVYHASVSQLTPIADLASFLGSGFDLSPFGGDTSMGVYLFQTSIPVSAVPEPASLSLLALGAVALLRRRAA